MPQVCKLSTLIEPLCCTTLTLLVRLCPVPVCPQSWCLPHLSSSPLLCLLTLSLPPPPPCVEMVHIMCLQAHAYRQMASSYRHTTQHQKSTYMYATTHLHTTHHHICTQQQSYAMYRDKQQTCHSYGTTVC